MSYPVIFLTRPWRRAILCGLIGLFFVISPLVILYTAGYRYDFAERKIKATGVISIDVSPDDALVTLSGTAITRPSSRLSFFGRDMASYELKNRAPGIYTLSLTRPGYHAWFKDIRVESNQTTYVRDVRLIPQTLPIKSTSIPGGIREAKASPSGRYVLLIGEKDELSNAYIYDTTLERTEPVIRDAETIRTAEWSPAHDDLLITLTSTSSEDILFLSEATAFTPIVLHHAAHTTTTFAWPHHGERDRSLFFVQDGTTVFTVVRNTSTPTFEVSSTAWFIDTDQAQWTVSDQTLQKRINGLTLETVPLPVDALDQILHVTPAYVLAKKNHDVFLLLRENNGVKQFSDVSQLFHVPQSSDVLIASGSELWRVSEDGTYSLINRLGKSIRSITTLPRFSSVVSYAGDDLLAIREDDLVSTLLFTAPLLSPVFLTHDGTRLSFLFQVGSSEPQLYTLPLVQ
jgi:hypothetical protein